MSTLADADNESPEVEVFHLYDVTFFGALSRYYFVASSFDGLLQDAQKFAGKEGFGEIKSISHLGTVENL